MNTYIHLNNGNDMPIIGLGTYGLNGKQCEDTVLNALNIGYQLIDTAELYGNHRDIGKALKKTRIPREEIFITSKVWYTELAHDDVLAACHRTLDELEIEYIDLYLIHWPNAAIPIKSTLRALQDLKDEGYIRAFGVSNFTIKHIKEIFEIGDSIGEPIQIAMNQIELHPGLFQKELVEFCQSNNIAVTAHSPFAQGQDFKDDLVLGLSYKYKCSPAQIILNWLMQKNIVVIPKATSIEHLKDNLETLSWDMDQDDVALIDSMKLHTRVSKPYFAEFDELE
jgi:2,5-diketo-D-gluconate reductase B